jgi:hypothetical protein
VSANIPGPAIKLLTLLFQSIYMAHRNKTGLLHVPSRHGAILIRHSATLGVAAKVETDAQK